MKTLLFPTDFSANSRHAVDYGYHLARQMKANVVLCNAFILPAEAPSTGMVVWPVDYNELIKEAESDIADLKSHLESVNEGTGFKPLIDFVAEVGTVTDVVNNAINAKKAELVVIGSHSGGLWTVFSGNHTERLIDHTSKPLLLVPPEAKIKIPRKIAFATDLKHPEDDLELACSLVPMAASLEAEIYITHVYQAKNVQQNIPARMAQFVNYCSNKTQYPFIYASILHHNHAISGFDQLCAYGDIDLLAMVHRPHSLFEAFFNGSQTQKMASHINIPLLVLPSLV